MNKRKPQQFTDGIIHRQGRKKIGDFKNTDALHVDQRVSSTATNKKIDFDVGEEDLEQLDMTKTTERAEQSELPKSKGKIRDWFARKKQKRAEKNARRSKLNRRLRKAGLIVGAILAIFILFFIIKGILAIRSIIVDRIGNGSPALTGDSSFLNGEGDGRVNIMLLGIGGEGHEGGQLADTIMIASIDPIAKEASILSIPRDLYVDIPGYWGSKINAAHAIGVDQDHPEGGGVGLMKETLEQTLDIPIHYFIKVDFQGFIKAVDAVGGVTLDVKEAVYDTNFWWQYGILDVPAGEQYFDGERALYFARSRYTSSRGDFSRNERQRDMMVALKDKVLSLGTFKDPRRISSLIDSVGNHVSTDLQLGEMLRLYELAEEIPSDRISTVGLDNAPQNFLVSGNINGGSVLLPADGTFEAIQKYVRELFIDGFIRDEDAPIDILNGSQTASIEWEIDSLLKSYGYNIQVVGPTTVKNNDQTKIFDLSDGSAPYTKRYLEKRFDVIMEDRSNLPQSISTESKFVILLGPNAEEEAQ